MSTHSPSGALPRLRAVGRAAGTLGSSLALVAGLLALWTGGLTPPAPSLAGTHASWAFDVGDDRLLTGFADNVFLGEVLSAEAGDFRWAIDGDVGYPTTVYTVRPVENIKGDLAGTVKLTQVGGYAPDGRLRLFDGDDLLAVGSAYLLIARRTVDGYEMAAPGYDHYLTQTSDQVAAPVERFTLAVADQQDPFAAPASPEPAAP